MERFAWVFGVWERSESVCSGVSKLSGSGLVRCRTDMIRENVCGACGAKILRGLCWSGVADGLIIF